MRHARALGRLAALVVALPMLGGASVCGEVLYDIAQRDLINEPVRQVNFTSDSGSVELFAFKRNGISLFFYLLGANSDIDDVGHRVEGDELEVFVLCATSGYCNANFYAEVPLGTIADIVTSNGGVKLVQVDAPVTADVVGGGVDGIQLLVPELDLTVEAGEVKLEWSAPPTRVDIVVGEGIVELTLPAGAYRCDLTADGTIDTTGITCDPVATALISVKVTTGDITLKAPTP